MSWQNDVPTRVKVLGPYTSLNTTPQTINVATEYATLAGDARYSAAALKAAGEKRLYIGGTTTASTVKVVRVDQGSASNAPDAATGGGRYYAGVDYPYDVVGTNDRIEIWADDDATIVYVHLCL